MAMNPNATMAAMNPMGGPVGGAPMAMMNPGAMNPQAAAAANAAAARQQQLNDNQRGVLNTYIYDYFIRYGMFDCARSLLSSDQQVNVHKDGKNGANGLGDDAMDTDSKDDIDSKLPEDLPPPKLPMVASDTSFLHEWFYLFWDIYTAQRAKGGNGTVNQYVAHTQQQEQLMRQMRPDLAQQQYQMQMVRNMQNGIGMKNNNLARAAMANNQNPQMMMAGAKQNPMQRDPSAMDGNRPSSPASGENAPSPNAKRQRLDSQSFNGNPSGSMPNGQPVPGMANNNTNMATAHQMLTNHGINPSSLTAQQLHNFANAPQAARLKSIQTYSQNLSQQQGTQMGNKPMQNAAGAQNQGSPMVPQGPDGAALNAFYNANDIAGPGGMRAAGPGGAQAASGSNHALQDYQMQLMLLEQQNKKRLMMARQEQDNMGGAQPGGPTTGPNGQPFPDASPQAVRAGASPNPADQAKRGTPQMNNSGIPSPVPEGGQSRDSPNPGMNFMPGHVDPNMAPHFFKGMEGQPQMNGMRPPSSHPGQPFNQQQMMAARQGQTGAPGNPQQWQQGPNGQMTPQGMQPGQGTPQQRAMPPPSAPTAAANGTGNRTTASPQQAAAAPPTPNQTTKAAPKKKETKAQKEKRAAAAKKTAAANASATPVADASSEQDAAPATPMTPATQGFPKNATATTGAAAASTPATTAGTGGPGMPGDPSQNTISMDTFADMNFNVGPMELANPLQSGDVLNDFDFDSFLHDGNDGNDGGFDFNAFGNMDGGELAAE
ncbi:Putative Protein F37C4.5 [[Torrubiella] hemipterigena]|uniref:LisH domain-containing protein n=1 Tax=[Torrubiella] hemipterigena TaxID=1531966 RepID=A0A0A1TI56_9HYPO|nr:Putative Protein F37C4.5 [[Torrubiella] hemipterigena]